jgi:hypothetical protein
MKNLNEDNNVAGVLVVARKGADSMKESSMVHILRQIFIHTVGEIIEKEVHIYQDRLKTSCLKLEAGFIKVHLLSNEEHTKGWP